MPGTSSAGYPYVLPADHPLEFPALSQQLATQLDANTRAIGAVAQLSGSIPSNASGITNIPISGTPEQWGGVTWSTWALYAPRTGLYHLTMNITFPTNGAGTVRGAWLITSTIDTPPPGFAVIGVTVPPSSSTGGVGMVLSASGFWRCDSGRGPITRVRHDAGSALTVTGMMSMRWIKD